MLTPFGDLFSEQITKGHKLHRSFSSFGEKSEGRLGRVLFFIIIFIIGLGILSVRLFNLTIIEGARFRKLSSENRVREIKIPSARGIIYDRNGVPLVHNVPVFTSEKGEIFFEEKPSTLSGELIEGVARAYPFGDLFAHTVGFTGEASREDLEDQKTTGAIRYQLGDTIGKMGVEKTYDTVLRGIDGRELYEVDAFEQKVRVLGRIEAGAGKNVTLTLSSKLQQIAKEKLTGKKGAVVVTNPATGEVLVLFSSPSFDPNVFIRRGDDVGAIFEDEKKPMFNRVIAGLYPPGSTFKIITALAALESGAITRNTKIEDTGILKVGDFSYANWYFTQYGKKEGMLDIVEALRRSNDIFFYKVGELTGIEKLASWARKVGVEATLGIDIPGEEKGLMPDPIWQEKTKGETWYLGNTYHVAIGQGDVLTTPLQVNAWTDVIANGGKLCRPQIAKYQISNIQYPKEQCKDLKIKKETIEIVKEGMKQACSPGGTGWPLFKFKVKSEKLKVDNVDFFEARESTISAKPMVEITTACKTGTAEFGDPRGRTHAWFTVFAPVVNPQISVTVIVEGGGEGSSVAAPIAKKILEEWFGREN